MYADLRSPWPRRVSGVAAMIDSRVGPRAVRFMPSCDTREMATDAAPTPVARTAVVDRDVPRAAAPAPPAPAAAPPAPPAPAPPAPPPSDRGWGVPLAVLIVGMFMSVLDISIINVAIPT